MRRVLTGRGPHGVWRRYFLAYGSVALLLMPWAGPAAAGSSGKGTSAAAFLRLPPGARASALGRAFGGVADDAYAAWHNPAGLGLLERVEAAAAREARFEGVNYDAAILAVPTLVWTDSPRPANAFGTAALAVYSLGASGIERRGLIESDAPSGTFGVADHAYALSYGFSPPGSGAALGATIKFVESRLDSARATALAWDGGALWKGERISLGAGVRALGGGLRYVSVADPLPTTLFAGGGWRPAPDWLLCAQIDLPMADAASGGVGVERRWRPGQGLEAFGRAGYDTARADAGALAGAALGLGLSWRSFEFDFAWSPGGVLGDLFKYSLLARFGGGRPALARPRRGWR